MELILFYKLFASQLLGKTKLRISKSDNYDVFESCYDQSKWHEKLISDIFKDVEDMWRTLLENPCKQVSRWVTVKEAMDIQSSPVAFHSTLSPHASDSLCVKNHTLIVFRIQPENNSKCFLVMLRKHNYMLDSWEIGVFGVNEHLFVVGILCIFRKDVPWIVIVTFEIRWILSFTTKCQRNPLVI